MKFSIVIPTYNRPQFLRKAVEAVFNQTYSDWELIIKEGGDGKGLDVIKDFLKDPRVTYIYSHDKGITNALNIALSLVTGDVINWANDDDILHNNTLEVVSKYITDKRWIYGKIACVKGDRKVTELGSTGDIIQLYKNNFIPQPSVFFSRYLFNKTGPFNENFDLASDYEYWLRLWKSSEPIFIDRVLADYTIHLDQASIKNMTKQLGQANMIKKL